MVESDCQREERNNEDHEEMERAIQDGHAVVLNDGMFPMGRFQMVAWVMGGEIVVCRWHDPKNDGNWHQCRVRGMFLPHGSLPKIRRLLEHAGYGQNGETDKEN